MKKSKVQFQKGYSILEFIAEFIYEFKLSNSKIETHTVYSDEIIKDL